MSSFPVLRTVYKMKSPVARDLQREIDFNAAAEKVKALTKRPSDEELLEIYGLFKQGSVGDNNTSKPGLLDLKGKYKWESWNKRKGMSKEDAMQAYIKLVDELVAKYA